MHWLNSMSTEIISVPENRALTDTELDFIKWLLEHGNERARLFLPQIERAWVTGRCNCGCASINFSIDGVTHYGEAGMEILCDYYWRNPDGALFGVFVFAYDDLLAGIDLYPIDSQSVASKLPPVAALTLDSYDEKQ